MRKRKVPNAVGGMYWIWEMPELEQEIPQLLSAAGRARVIDKSSIRTHIEVDLKESAKVINWRDNEGGGVAVNSKSLACINTPLIIEVRKLPKNGDKKVYLSFAFELAVYNEDGYISLDIMRKHLRSFAEAMTRTWFYHYK